MSKPYITLLEDIHCTLETQAQYLWGITDDHLIFLDLAKQVQAAIEKITNDA